MRDIEQNKGAYNSIKERIKTIVDQIVVERDYQQQLIAFEELLGEVIPYALRDYSSCRDIIQFMLSHLERISSVSIPFLFRIIRDQLEKIQVASGTPSFLEYISGNIDGEGKELLDKVAPFFEGEQYVFALHPEVAEVLDQDERRKMISFILDYIQAEGLKSQWTNDIIQNTIFLCSVLYSICKKDGVMPLLFHVYMSIIDRLNTSGNNQDARDVAEGILTIGYNEGFLPEAYLCACRAYTGANNGIAGLLFYYVSLSQANDRGAIDEKFTFDVLWQYLKICRVFGLFPKSDIEIVTKCFDNAIKNDRDRLSFYHTLFSLRLIANEGYGSLVSDVEDFLALNREAFYRNLEYGSMPWITLLVSMQEVLPNENYSGLMLYVAAARQVACKEGNEMYFDLLEGKNLAKHLKETQFKLQSTRDRSDYAMDNQMAMIIAKKLLCQAYKDRDAKCFLMAMSPKTDFSIVLPIREVNGVYRRMDIQDVDGDELLSIYSNPTLVMALIALEDEDIIYWIGRGNHEFLVMTFFDGLFKMEFSIGVSRKDVKDSVNRTASLHYERETKEPGRPIYVKSDAELEEEGIELEKELESFSVCVPSSSKRVIFIKDLEIAAYPHQLFVDSNSGLFVGAENPSCNALSTELFIKTNTSNSLPDGFSKAFWIPYGGEEFTFDMIYGKLEDEIIQHGISVQKTLSRETPLTADMVFLCAHGGYDISTSEVFYVNEQPIIDTLPCIGNGKVAVLFICYSGTISRSLYDNAMHTLVKKLVLKGYSSIVAPMWSLPTEIIKPWLATFLTAMEKGEYIIDAVYSANMVVKAGFVAPSAWACLHLFGNPFTSVAEGNRIVITENPPKDSGPNPE